MSSISVAGKYLLYVIMDALWIFPILFKNLIDYFDYCISWQSKYE